MYLNVPINWNSTNLTTCTETIQIYVKRYFLSGYQNQSHHLWRIPGILFFRFTNKSMNFVE
jgi:hypothetical protein